MKASDRKYGLFAATGAGAAILHQPFFYGALRLPEAVYAAAPGIIFAISMTFSAMFLSHSGGWHPGLLKRYIQGAVVLAAGMPAAFIAGATSMAMTDRLVPGDKFHLGGIGLPFLLGEIVSCLAWSSVLFAGAILVNKAGAFQVLRLAVVVTIAVMLTANLAEVISSTLWQKSLLLPVISIAEEVGSALVLATGWADLRRALEDRAGGADHVPSER